MGSTWRAPAFPYATRTRKKLEGIGVRLVAMRVDVNPELIVWARERSGVAVEDLRHRFPKLDEWERGELDPTLKQLEGFARANPYQSEAPARACRVA